MLKTLKKLLLLTGAVFFCSNLLSAESGLAKYQYYGDREMWRHLFASSEAYCIPESAVPSALMIPHHDIAVDRQNSMYKALSRQVNPSVIVVVSPDHFETGTNLITMPENTVFASPDGDVLIDYDMIARIACHDAVKPYVSLQSDVWSQEHGIFAHTPFLKHYFPEAAVIPVLVKMLTPDDQFSAFEALGKVLAELLPDDALFISSVDCSHYQIPRTTALHDAVSRNTIQNLEDPRNAEIDSPESITALFSYCASRQAVTPVQIDSSSTRDYIPDDFVESTSHFYYLFYKDGFESQINRFNERVQDTQQNSLVIDYDHTLNQTILIAGSGAVGAGICTTWKWDRYQQSENKADILLRELAGKEARFLYGFDALVFDPAPGTMYERTLHKTTLKIKTVLSSCLQNVLIPMQKDLQTIDILEIVMDEDDAAVENALSFYDVVVVRDDEGCRNAFAYIKQTDGTYDKINLGILYSKDDPDIQGTLLALNWVSGELFYELYDYESDTGVAPAIFQFASY